MCERSKRQYIRGELTESGLVDMRRRLQLNINIEKETNELAAWAFPWKELAAWAFPWKKEMSLDPRSMANATANEILMGQFPEQGSELVSTYILFHFFLHHCICSSSASPRYQLKNLPLCSERENPEHLLGHFPLLLLRHLHRTLGQILLLLLLVNKTNKNASSRIRSARLKSSLSWSRLVMSWWCTDNALMINWWCTYDAWVSYLISLTPKLFKNIAHVGSFENFVFPFVFVFVFVFLFVFVLKLTMGVMGRDTSVNTH